MHLLALDWRRAFDSINPDALLNSLRRFGLPSQLLQIIKDIYTDRRFCVHECGSVSNPKAQLSGICQGCPLSPFLFVIVMTTLMEDAVNLLSPSALQAMRAGDLADLLYADDTLVFGVQARHVEEFAAAIENMGATYGMSLH